MDLRKKIAKLLNMNYDEFIMKRSSKNGCEIKEYQSTLDQEGYVSGTYVFIEFGNFNFYYVYYRNSFI